MKNFLLYFFPRTLFDIIFHSLCPEARNISPVFASINILDILFLISKRPHLFPLGKIPSYTDTQNPQVMWNFPLFVMITVS